MTVFRKVNSTPPVRCSSQHSLFGLNQVSVRNTIFIGTMLSLLLYNHIDCIEEDLLIEDFGLFIRSSCPSWRIQGVLKVYILTLVLVQRLTDAPVKVLCNVIPNLSYAILRKQNKVRGHFCFL